MADDSSADTLTLTAEIVASYVVSNAHVQASEIPNIIRSVRAALMETDEPAPSQTEAAFPKADKRAINKSITPDALISFVDSKPYKTLKRHLSGHGMDMAAYRQRYGLPKGYPSVAPNYSAARSAIAKSLGLGARGRGGGRPAPAEETIAPAKAPEPSPAKAPGGRGKKKGAAE